MTVLCLLNQCDERAQRNIAAPDAIQPDQPLEGGTLPLIQPGQLLRQEIERGQVLTRLKAGKQNVEFPVVLYLPFHLGTRGGPKPLPHIQ